MVMDFLTIVDLPPELRQAVTHYSLTAGQTLFQEGEVASAFFVVETGRIRLMRYTAEGRTVIFQSVEPGAGLAEVALISDQYSCTAIAEVDSSVIAYPKSNLIAALRQYPTLTESFIAMLIRSNEAMRTHLELRDIRAAHERVLQYLRHLVRLNNRRIIQFDRPMKDVAAELGLAPETFSRALSRLEQEGRITRLSGEIWVNESSAA